MMRKWTETAETQRRAATPLATEERVTDWPRALALALGVWILSYLARQALTLGNGEVPFSPLGSFALEGIALAVAAFGGVLAWSLTALAALRDIEQAMPIVPDQHSVSARSSSRMGDPVPVLEGYLSRSGRFKSLSPKLQRMTSDPLVRAHRRQRDQTDQRRPKRRAVRGLHLRRRPTPLTLKEVRLGRLDDAHDRTRQRAA